MPPQDDPTTSGRADRRRAPGPPGRAGAPAARPEEVGLSHRPGGVSRHLAAHACRVHGARVGLDLARCLRRHLRPEPDRRPLLRGPAGPGHTQPAGHEPGRGRDRRHLPHRVGARPLGGLRLGRVGERRPGRVPGLAHDRSVEPRRDGRGAKSMLTPGLASVRADARPVHDDDRVGRLHASLRHPHGRGDHGAEGKADGAEGGGGGDASDERRPLPVSDLQIRRDFHDPRRAR